MRIVARREFAVLPVMYVMLLLIGCPPLIAPYNETAYQNATSIKAESMLLMEKATEPYSQHSNQVDDLRLRLSQAYEFAKGLPNNELSATQWEILIDPNRNLLGGFLKRWKDDGQLGPEFVNQSKLEIGKAFDKIIELESGKIRT